jgi:hypothetical protein
MLIAALFSIGTRRPGTWSGVLGFFLIVFLSGWAAGIWVVPIGPSWAGVRLFPAVMVAVIVALLLAATVPPHYPTSSGEAVRQRRTERAVLVAYNVFFWILVLVLIAAVAAGYFFPAR